MFGDLDPHRRKVEHVTAFHPDRARIMQVCAAATAHSGS
jgi:tRNA G10  N-methylase Trm11